MIGFNTYTATTPSYKTSGALSSRSSGTSQVEIG